MKRRAFTLIEMLLVIAIILILAGLLYPVFTSARESVHQAGCVTHLRQIGIALRLYLNDHDDGFPAGAYHSNPAIRRTWDRAWQDTLTAYVTEPTAFTCPAATLRTSTRDSYGCNPWLSRWFGAARESQVAQPSRTLYSTEHAIGDWPSFPPSYLQANPIPYAEQYCSARHFGRTMALFVDGHVRRLEPAALDAPEVIWKLR